jgi:hypothetical protein
MLKRRVSIVLLLALLVAGGCSEDNPTQPNPPVSGSPKTLGAVKDNTLYEDMNGDWSNGAGFQFFAGTTDPNGGSGEPREIRRGVLAFDVAGEIPAGSTIDSVFLVLTMTKTKLPATNHSVALHRLSADWGEGTSAALGNEGGGAASAPNDATWIHRFHPDSLWANAGGDFDPAARDAQVVGNVGTYTWGSTAIMVADVQSWLDTPAGNFGWILIGDEGNDATAKRFASRTNFASQNRPKLIVFYTEP